MKKIERNNKYSELLKTLLIDCEECCGLCCTALYCTKTDGFPEDKVAGKPCKNLRDDFKCEIHNKLADKHLKGCMSYDCFGSGQKVTQDIYAGVDWKKSPKQADEMFQVFLIVYQLHQMLWYLIEAANLISEENLQDKIKTMIDENVKMTQMSPEKIIALDLEEYRGRVNSALKETCKLVHSEIQNSSDQNHIMDCIGKNFKNKNLDGKDFSMTLLIASNFEGCSLRGTNFLGADMRDTNFKNANLSQSLFLTQMQINSAIGNSNTKLPLNLTMPEIWK